MDAIRVLLYREVVSRRNKALQPAFQLVYRNDDATQGINWHCLVLTYIGISIIIPPAGRSGTEGRANVVFGHLLGVRD